MTAYIHLIGSITVGLPFFRETLKAIYMEVINTAIDGVLIIEPRVFED